MLGQVPLAAVMGLTGIVCSALFIGFAPAISAFATEATTFLTNAQVATLAAVPDDGKLRGGLRHVGRHVPARPRAAQPLAWRARARHHRRLRRLRRADRLVARHRGDDRAGRDSRKCGRAAIRRRSPPAAARPAARSGPIVPPGSGPIIVFALLDRGLHRPVVRRLGRPGDPHHPVLFHHRDALRAARAGLGARRRASASRASCAKPRCAASRSASWSPA